MVPGKMKSRMMTSPTSTAWLRRRHFTISMAPESNPNVVAVAPEAGLTIFDDGFESGDTAAWSTTR